MCAVLADYRQIGDDLLARFNAGNEEQLWYFNSLVPVFKTVGAEEFLTDEFERTLAELKRVVGAA